MNILIINPPRVNGLCVIREDRCEITERESVFPPYSLAQLAAVLREQGHNVDLIDANCLDLSYDEIKNLIFEHKKLNAVIFRFTPTTYKEDLQVCKIAKMSDSHIFTIGICWTLRNYAEQVLEKCNYLDFYAIDEPLICIPQILDFLDRHENLTQVSGIVYRNEKRIIRSQIKCINFDYDSIPMPAYDLLPSLDKYYLRGSKGLRTLPSIPAKVVHLVVSTVQFRAQNGMLRSAKTVFAEIKYLCNNHHVKTISFFDETFTFDRESSYRNLYQIN